MSRDNIKRVTKLKFEIQGLQITFESSQKFENKYLAHKNKNRYNSNSENTTTLIVDCIGTVAPLGIY